jgi:hypothetical protein
VAEDFDQRIRKGLRFVTRANGMLLKAGRQLEMAIGDEVFGAIKLQPYEFQVENTPYSGKLTEEQYLLLKGSQKTKSAFADAVARLVDKVHNPVIIAEEDLLAALQPGAAPTGRPTSAAAAKARPTRFSPRLMYGTCDYDTGQVATCVTQYVCRTAYAGTWTPDGC